MQKRNETSDAAGVRDDAAALAREMVVESLEEAPTAQGEEVTIWLQRYMNHSDRTKVHQVLLRFFEDQVCQARLQLNLSQQSLQLLRESLLNCDCLDEYLDALRDLGALFDSNFGEDLCDTCFRRWLGPLGLAAAEVESSQNALNLAIHALSTWQLAACIQNGSGEVSTREPVCDRYT